MHGLDSSIACHQAYAPICQYLSLSSKEAFAEVFFAGQQVDDEPLICDLSFKALRGIESHIFSGDPGQTFPILHVPGYSSSSVLKFLCHVKKLFRIRLILNTAVQLHSGSNENAGVDSFGVCLDKFLQLYDYSISNLEVAFRTDRCQISFVVLLHQITLHETLLVQLFKSVAPNELATALVLDVNDRFAGNCIDGERNTDHLFLKYGNPENWSVLSTWELFSSLHHELNQLQSCHANLVFSLSTTHKREMSPWRLRVVAVTALLQGSSRYVLGDAYTLFFKHENVTDTNVNDLSHGHCFKLSNHRQLLFSLSCQKLWDVKNDELSGLLETGNSPVHLLRGCCEWIQGRISLLEITRCHAMKCKYDRSVLSAGSGSTVVQDSESIFKSLDEVEDMFTRLCCLFSLPDIRDMLHQWPASIQHQLRYEDALHRCELHLKQSLLMVKNKIQESFYKWEEESGSSSATQLPLPDIKALENDLEKLNQVIKAKASGKNVVIPSQALPLSNVAETGSSESPLNEVNKEQSAVVAPSPPATSSSSMTVIDREIGLNPIEVESDIIEAAVSYLKKRHEVRMVELERLELHTKWRKRRLTSRKRNQLALIYLFDEDKQNWAKEKLYIASLKKNESNENSTNDNATELNDVVVLEVAGAVNDPSDCTEDDSVLEGHSLTVYNVSVTEQTSALVEDSTSVLKEHELDETVPLGLSTLLPMPAEVFTQTTTHTDDCGALGDKAGSVEADLNVDLEDDGGSSDTSVTSDFNPMNGNDLMEIVPEDNMSTVSEVSVISQYSDGRLTTNIQEDNVLNVPTSVAIVGSTTPEPRWPYFKHEEMRDIANLLIDPVNMDNVQSELDVFAAMKSLDLSIDVIGVANGAIMRSSEDKDSNDLTEIVTNNLGNLVPIDIMVKNGILNIYKQQCFLVDNLLLFHFVSPSSFNFLAHFDCIMDSLLLSPRSDFLKEFCETMVECHESTLTAMRDRIVRDPGADDSGTFSLWSSPFGIQQSFSKACVNAHMRQSSKIFISECCQLQVNDNCCGNSLGDFSDGIFSSVGLKQLQFEYHFPVVDTLNGIVTDALHDMNHINIVTRRLLQLYQISILAKKLWGNLHGVYSSSQSRSRLTGSNKQKDTTRNSNRKAGVIPSKVEALLRICSAAVRTVICVSQSLLDFTSDRIRVLVLTMHNELLSAIAAGGFTGFIQAVAAFSNRLPLFVFAESTGIGEEKAVSGGVTSVKISCSVETLQLHCRKVLRKANDCLCVATETINYFVADSTNMYNNDENVMLKSSELDQLLGECEIEKRNLQQLARRERFDSFYRNDVVTSKEQASNLAALNLFLTAV